MFKISRLVGETISVLVEASLRLKTGSVKEFYNVEPYVMDSHHPLLRFLGPSVIDKIVGHFLRDVAYPYFCD